MPVLIELCDVPPIVAFQSDLLEVGVSSFAPGWYRVVRML